MTPGCWAIACPLAVASPNPTTKRPASHEARDRVLSMKTSLSKLSTVPVPYRLCRLRLVVGGPPARTTSRRISPRTAGVRLAGSPPSPGNDCDHLNLQPAANGDESGYHRRR